MVDRSPGNNPDFVLGLKYLQNRERIVRTLMKGHAIVGNDHPISPAYPDHCSELEIREFDPDKAKFHLQKSGISEATVLAGEVRPGVTDFCLMLQEEARKVGFTLNVKKVPTDGYWGTVWMNTAVCATGWNMRPSANLMLTLAYKSDAAWNESAWNNARFDQLLLDSRAEKDAAKRHEMYCEMQRLIRDEGGQLIPCHINYVDAVSKKVRGLGRCRSAMGAAASGRSSPGSTPDCPKPLDRGGMRPAQGCAGATERRRLDNATHGIARGRTRDKGGIGTMLKTKLIDVTYTHTEGMETCIVPPRHALPRRHHPAGKAPHARRRRRARLAADLAAQRAEGPRRDVRRISDRPDRTGPRCRHHLVGRGALQRHVWPRHDCARHGDGGAGVGARVEGRSHHDSPGYDGGTGSRRGGIEPAGHRVDPFRERSRLRRGHGRIRRAAWNRRSEGGYFIRRQLLRNRELERS